MNNITNSTSDNTNKIIKIYDWSIRKVIFKHAKYYVTYLIGYVPSYHKLEITCIERIFLKKRLISEDCSDDLYSLRGSFGLSDEAEEIWCDYKKLFHIKYEIDISHKYKNADAERRHNKLMARYGPYFYMPQYLFDDTSQT